MILVTGEALIDMLPLEAEGRTNFAPVPGGSPFNVALALGRLATPVRFLCPLSRDAFGEELARTLLASNVDLTGCPHTDALSTLGFVTLDPQSRTARYAFYTDGTAGCLLRTADIPAALPDALSCLHVGSFSLAVEPFGSTVEHLLQIHRHGRVISLDPNIRPFLIRDRTSFLRRLDRIVALADIVKLSEEDLAWLHPGVACDSVARDYLSRGVKLVVITLGGAGAEAFTRLAQARVPAPGVSVVDTVGAGDTFQAALLAWLWKRGLLAADGLATLGAEAIHAATAFACRAAAFTCSRAGCNPPWLSELQELDKAGPNRNSH